MKNYCRNRYVILSIPHSVLAMGYNYLLVEYYIKAMQLMEVAMSKDFP